MIIYQCPNFNNGWSRGLDVWKHPTVCFRHIYSSPNEAIREVDIAIETLNYLAIWILVISSELIRKFTVPAYVYIYL